MIGNGFSSSVILSLPLIELGADAGRKDLCGWLSTRTWLNFGAANAL
jgi:hypothetical protein